MYNPLCFTTIFLAIAILTGYQSCDAAPVSEKILFDFNSPTTRSLDNWSEKSDTVRTVGLSKATAAIFKNSQVQRAVFFALLNLQPNGAGFAGMHTVGAYDLSPFTNLKIQCKAQGAFKGWKVVLKHKNQDDSFPTYEQFFTAPTDNFETVTLPLSDFKPYFRGQLVKDGEPLDYSQISSIGLQTYGGIYEENKRQHGPLTLEIDWIKAV